MSTKLKIRQNLWQHSVSIIYMDIVWGLLVSLPQNYSQKYILECNRAVFQNHFKDDLHMHQNVAFKTQF